MCDYLELLIGGQTQVQMTSHLLEGLRSLGSGSESGQALPR